MSATGTPTPNIGLRIPLGTDPASVDDINYNSNLIDTKLGAVGNDSVQDQIDELNGNKMDKLILCGSMGNGLNTFNVANSSRFVIICSDSTGARCGAWICYATGSGGTNAVPILSAADITVSFETNKIKMQVNGTPQYMLMNMYNDPISNWVTKA